MGKMLLSSSNSFENERDTRGVWYCVSVSITYILRLGSRGRQQPLSASIRFDLSPDDNVMNERSTRLWKGCESQNYLVRNMLEAQISL